MKIAVSACLLGTNCKYNGKNNQNDRLLSLLKGHEMVPVCPEVAGGLGIPRTPVELQNGTAINADGENVDAQFRLGVEKTLDELYGQDIDLVVLQSRSPTCGAKQIYDGSFSKRLIDGQGMLAKALTERGYRIMDVEDIESFPFDLD